MNMNKYLEGVYMNSAYVVENNLTEKALMIVDVTEEEVGKTKERKPVIRFAETERKLVLNTTNLKRLIKALGENSEEWKTRLIKLRIIQVNFEGEVVDSIVVDTNIGNEQKES